MKAAKACYSFLFLACSHVAAKNRSPQSTDVPLYLWVPEATKSRFLEMCEEENVSIHEMLARWSSLRSFSRDVSNATGTQHADSSLTPRDVPTPVGGGAESIASDVPQHSGDALADDSSSDRAQVGATHTDRDMGNSVLDQSAGFARRSNWNEARCRPGTKVAGELQNDFLLHLTEDDLALLHRLAAKRKPLLATWTTGEPKYMDLALNLALSVRINSPSVEQMFVCVALDRAARRAMRRHGFQAVSHLVPSSGPELKDAIWKMRWLILHTFAHLGIDGLVMDSDIVVLQNPFQVLHRDADLEVMTDHFWPEQHLWKYWVRPEENINTGFIYEKASKHIKLFLKKFLQAHNESDVGGIARHWMDQQVFNKYVEQHMLHSKGDLVHSFYGEHLVVRNIQATQTIKRPIKIRILDPVVVAHGMNYFWLRAHDTPGNRRQVVVAHANGVDGKEYFLRDRGVWYIDDFDKRFGREEFLTYDHPMRLSLQEDFEHLVEAMVVASALQRRLVLPGTMNCDNCPALEPYKAMATLGGKCTFDYFAWSQSFLGHHGELVAEHGLLRHPRFLSLSSQTLSPGIQTSSWIRKKMDAKSPGHAPQSRRLHVTDIREAYAVVVEAGFGPWNVFECKHHDWPVGWMACREQRFVRFHGEFSKCLPEPGQPACGYRGVTCCESFWGWGEKLEYFTGRRWDLPCNCGLSKCATASLPHGNSIESHACCSHTSGSSEPKCDRRLRMDSVPEVNTPEDTHSLSSTALSELDHNESGPVDFWRLCRINRQLRFGDQTVEEIVWHCHRLAFRYLLLRQNLQALASWCRYAHRLRRTPASFTQGQVYFGIPARWPTAALRRTLDAETGVPDDGVVHATRGKISHDLHQLKFLAEEKASAVLILPEAEALVAAFEKLVASTDQVQPGDSEDATPTAKPKESVSQLLSTELGGYFNRAIFVPELHSSSRRVLQPLILDDAATRLHENGFAVADEVLRRPALEDLAFWMARATIWHSSLDEGRVLQASLFDGLNCDMLLQIAQEIASIKSPVAPRFDIQSSQNSPRLVLEDVWAWKYEAGSFRVLEKKLYSADPPDLLACMWLTAPASGVPLQGLQLSKQFVAYKQNRLIMLTAEERGTLRAGSWQSDFRNRRIDLIFTFRKSVGHPVYPGLSRYTSTRWPDAP
eukprot:TRINITY_DN12956_c0_g1_i1.p1 TRINITY_DN12956_c0_g1~~TRINITY_DN12956_c0_g1_i1.p1  ORF type:complete len:1182 (+),score=143.87 TRINITY_DN12956_c0_g1_i1:64-3546(+)